MICRSLLGLSSVHNSQGARLCLAMLLSSGFQFPELHFLHATKLPLLDQAAFSLPSFERYYRYLATGVLENEMVQKEIIQKEIIKHICLDMLNMKLSYFLGRKELLRSSSDLPHTPAVLRHLGSPFLCVFLPQRMWRADRLM